MRKEDIMTTGNMKTHPFLSAALFAAAMIMAAGCGDGGGGEEDTDAAQDPIPDPVSDDVGTDDTGVDDSGPVDLPADDGVTPDPVDVPPDTVDEDVSPDVEPDTTPPDCVYAPADIDVLEYSAIFRDQTYDAAEDLVAFESEECGTNPDSPERVYGVRLTEETEIYVETDCGMWNCQVVVTRDGCQADDLVACETTPQGEAFAITLEAGFYYIFVEGNAPSAVNDFDIMINIHHTGGQATCDVAQVLDIMNTDNCDDPWDDSPHYLLNLDSENLDPSEVDDFFVEGVDDCTSDDGHVGGAPDKVYQFEITGTEDRDVSIELNPSFWAAKMYVTTDPCGAFSSVVACSETWFNEDIDVTLSPGVYYLVVDGDGEEVFNDNAWGDFTLEFRIYDDVCNS
jgi:hypothetical protein